MKTAAPHAFDEGVRARLGVILPSVNTVVEPWFARAAPDGVSVLASRMLLADRLSPEGIAEMDRIDGLRAVEQIASCRPSAVAYCCTASSVVQGHDYDAHLRETITRVCGVPATTATHAILSALDVLGAQRICVASPYVDAVDALEHAFFAAAGCEILGTANLNIADSFRLAEPDAETLVGLGRRAWKDGAEALVLTCLNTRSHYVAEELEAELGKPVVTSTQATFWHLLRLCGVNEPIAGYGCLLRQ
jgi:maleate isomerase